MKDLEFTLFRNLGHKATGIKAVLDVTNDPPSLHMRWLRLGSWRQIPSSVAIPAYRIAVHDTTRVTGTDSLPTLHGDGVRSGRVTRFLPTVGIGRHGGGA